jgi:hypothetical protein
MKKLLFYLLTVMLLSSCQKVIDTLANVTNPTSYDYVAYTIPAGQQYSNPSPFRSVQTSEMKFVVKFDSSAIYTNVNPVNQYDINKLFGFSDNNADHQDYSARFGWRWSDGALRLFAYTYNKGARASRELGTVAIGAEISCSIKVADSTYIFSIGDKAITTMPRLSTTPQGQGYQLYPYFGGDELAPHNINISIKQVK